MKRPSFGKSFLLLVVLLFASNVWAGETLQMLKVAAANPCSMKHNPCNPCAGMAKKDIDPSLVKRPAGVASYSGLSRAKLVKQGEKLFKDKSLSTIGISCNTCHATNDMFKLSFSKPYPHSIGMAKERAGLSGKLHADEFVQFCMLAPMAAKTLPWDSKELAALAAYVEDVKQPNYRSWAAKNPCAMKHNPCAMKGNPCAMKHNPCGMKGNPCAMKHNPCGMKGNPCAMKHNPCGMKGNPCAMKHNPCGMKGNPCAMKHNPCGMKENPCSMKH